MASRDPWAGDPRRFAAFTQRVALVGDSHYSNRVRFEALGNLILGHWRVFGLFLNQEGIRMCLEDLPIPEDWKWVKDECRWLRHEDVEEFFLDEEVREALSPLVGALAEETRAIVAGRWEETFWLSWAMEVWEESDPEQPFWVALLE